MSPSIYVRTISNISDNFSYSGSCIVGVAISYKLKTMNMKVEYKIKALFLVIGLNHAHIIFTWKVRNTFYA